MKSSRTGQREHDGARACGGVGVMCLIADTSVEIGHDIRDMLTGHGGGYAGEHQRRDGSRRTYSLNSLLLRLLVEIWQNQGDVNDALGYKKKAVVVTSNPLALVAEKTKNGDHPLPVVSQVSLAGTAPNAIPTLKDPKFWTAEEKKTRKIDQRQMRGSEYGEQDRKAAILYEYETFKSTEGDQFLNTYLRYLQVINDLKKCGYKKDNCELNYKFLNNLQLEWKQYGTLMRQTKNLMDINIDALYNILKQNQGDVNDALGYKKKAVVVTSNPLALVVEKTKITALLAKAFNRKKYYAKPTNNNLRTSLASSSANKKPEYVKSVEKKEDKKVDEKKRDMSKVKCYNFKKEGHFAKDCKKVNVKDYNYYKTNMKSMQIWSFMAKIEKVLSDSDESFSSAEETIAK
nr:hypothetical protein [Tanacetum cinerariifolium]